MNADAQDEPLAADAHWSDDEGRSLHFASDLVPFKRRADVVLVGHAYAPRQEPVSSLVARLIVGDLDKSIEVTSDRAFAQDGSLREGSRFVKMPLVYERAAGGPDTMNPVGVRGDAGPNRYGLIPLPNLLPPGTHVASPKDHIAPWGVGPIAPHWPSRAQMIPARAMGFSHRSWHERHLPEGLDPAYFNVAPADQQVEQLRPNERIVMENLSPDHPRLVTSLPGTTPRAVVERNGGSEELVLRCDTLVLDTDRGLATLTWRGHVMMDQPRQPGRVSISMAGAAPPAPRKNIALRQTVDASAIEQAKAALPFLQSREVGAPSFKAPPLPPPPPPSPPPSPPPPPLFAPDSVPRPASPWAVDPGRSGGMSIGQLAAEGPPSPPRVQAPLPEAAETAPALKASPEKAMPARPREAPAEIVSLLWFEAKALPRIRRRPRWRVIFDALEQDAPDVDLDAEDLEPMAVDEDRRDVLALLARGAPTDTAGMREAVREAIRGDGSFVEPLVLTSGDLALSFDELEMLKATIAVVTPFLPADKALKDLVDGVNELIKSSSLDGSNDVAEGYTARIRDAFGATKRGLPANYLESRTERMLLEQRRYQKRIVLGKTCLRGAFTAAGSDEAMPAYLPDSLAKELPMMKRFSARLVAEVCLQQDQGESHPHALRVVALGRTASYSTNPR